MGQLKCSQVLTAPGQKRFQFVKEASVRGLQKHHHEPSKGLTREG